MFTWWWQIRFICKQEQEAVQWRIHAWFYFPFVSSKHAIEETVLFPPQVFQGIPGKNQEHRFLLIFFSIRQDAANQLK